MYNPITAFSSFPHSMSDILQSFVRRAFPADVPPEGQPLRRDGLFRVLSVLMACFLVAPLTSQYWSSIRPFALFVTMNAYRRREIAKWAFVSSFDIIMNLFWVSFHLTQPQS